jgi:methyl-accepting chemotaxis protein
MADNIDAQALIDRLSEVEDQFGLVNGSLVSFLRSVKKNTADFDKEIKKLNKGIERGTKGFQDQLYVLQQLNDAIEELADQAQDAATKDKVTQLQKQRAALLEQAAYQNAREQLEYFGEELKKAAITGTGKFVRGLQDGASSTQLTSTVLNAGIDIAAGAAVGLGKALQTAGPAMAALGPLGVIAGYCD